MAQGITAIACSYIAKRSRFADCGRVLRKKSKLSSQPSSRHYVLAPPLRLEEIKIHVGYCRSFICCTLASALLLGCSRRISNADLVGGRYNIVVRPSSRIRHRRHPSPGDFGPPKRRISQVLESSRTDIKVERVASNTYISRSAIQYPEHGTDVGISHLSTTVRSTLFPSRTALILCLHDGFAFGFEPLDAASKMVWLMETMLSWSEEVMPQAPRPGE